MRPVKGDDDCIARWDGDGWSVEIRVDPAQLEARLALTGTPPEGSDARSRVLETVRSTALVLSPEEQACLDDRVERLLRAATADPIIIARGAAPEESKPPEITWQVAFEIVRDPDSDGALDLREVTCFPNVSEGQTICALTEPAEPRPGRDVFGNVIPAPTASVVELPFKLGARVAMREDERIIVALADGCVTRADGKLNVEQVLEVRGDVDYRIGNIEYRGKVVIHGSVLPGFKVKGTRGVTVQGDVIGATVESGWDIKVEGGVFGRNRPMLRAGGQIHVKYLSCAAVEAGRGVVIQRGVMSSDVMAAGDFVAEAGAVVGGRVRVAGNIRVQVLGSDGDVPTVVVAGVDVIALKRADELRKALAKARGRMNKLERLVGPLVNDPKRLASLPPARAARDRKRIQELLDCCDEVWRMEEDLEMIRAVPPSAQTYVSFSRKAYAKTEIHIGARRSRKLDEETTGPLRMRIHPETGELVGDRF